MSEPQSPEEAFAAMSAPGEAHQKLEPFAGTFKAEVRLWMGADEPLLSTGTMVNAWDLGGRYLKMHYTGDPIDGPYPSLGGRGFWGYNKIIERYEGFWIDNASTVMQFETGDLDDSGKVWTMTGELLNPETGEPVEKTSRITLVDEDHHTLEMYFGSGEEAVKSMEFRYARA